MSITLQAIAYTLSLTACGIAGLLTTVIYNSPNTDQVGLICLTVTSMGSYGQLCCTEVNKFLTCFPVDKKKISMPVFVYFLINFIDISDKRK